MAHTTQTTQTTHLHPRHPRVPRTHARTNSSDLKALIEQHMEWQDDALRPNTRGTLLVDWDGNGEPLLSYRSEDAPTNPVADEVESVESVDKKEGVGEEVGEEVGEAVERDEEEREEKPVLLYQDGDMAGLREDDEGVEVDGECEEEESEEERGVREVLEEMLEKMVSREEVVGEKERGREVVRERWENEEERKVQVQTGFLIRRKPVPIRQSVPVTQSVSMTQLVPVRQSVPVAQSIPVRWSAPVAQSVAVRQPGDERKKKVGAVVSVDKAVPKVAKGLPQVPAEEQVEMLPIFYRYKEVPGVSDEREKVKKKVTRRSVGRVAEVLKEEGSEVWGMLKYEGKELMAIIKYEGKELFQEVKDDSKELMQGWREEGRWLSVVLRNEWRDGRMFVGKGIKKVVCYV